MLGHEDPGGVGLESVIFDKQKKIPTTLSFQGEKTSIVFYEKVASFSSSIMGLSPNVLSLRNLKISRKNR
jgi:hypothetical protein